MSTPGTSPAQAAAPVETSAPRLALSKQEAADALGVSVDTLEAMRGLRKVKIGRRVVIAVAELQRWLDVNGAVSE